MLCINCRLRKAFEKKDSNEERKKILKQIGGFSDQELKWLQNRLIVTVWECPVSRGSFSSFVSSLSAFFNWLSRLTNTQFAFLCAHVWDCLYLFGHLAAASAVLLSYLRLAFKYNAIT